MLKTVGISPKVYAPAIGQIIVGAVLWALGDDVEGRTLVLSGLATFGVGFSAPNSPVVTVGAEDPVEPTPPIAGTK